MATQILLKRGLFNIADSNTAIVTPGELGFNLLTLGNNIYSFPEVFGVSSHEGTASLVNPVVELNRSILNSELVEDGPAFSNYLFYNRVESLRTQPINSNAAYNGQWVSDFLSYGTAFYDSTSDSLEYGSMYLSPDKFVMRSGKYYTSASVNWAVGFKTFHYYISDLDPAFIEASSNATFTIPIKRSHLTHIINVESDSAYGYLYIDFENGNLQELGNTIVFIKSFREGVKVVVNAPANYSIYYSGAAANNITTEDQEVIKLEFTNLYNSQDDNIGQPRIITCNVTKFVE